MSSDNEILTIKDGIVNKEKWDKASVKVLFLLKESYGTLQGTYSLTEWYNNNNPYGQTGQGCVRLLKAILDTTDLIPDDEILRYAAFVNLNNEYNTDKITPWKKLQSIFNKEKYKVVLDKIREIKPEVIFCGNTYWLLRQKNNALPTMSKGQALLINNTNTVFDGIVMVNGYHPMYKNDYTKPDSPTNACTISERVHIELNKRIK